MSLAIHYPSPLIQYWLSGDEGGVHSEQVTSSTMNTYIHTYGQFRVTLASLACFLTVEGSRRTRRKAELVQGDHTNSTQKGPDLLLLWGVKTIQ